MFRILMLSADVLQKPMGGLGEHIRELSIEIVRQRPDACIDVVSSTYGQDYAFQDRICQRYALMVLRSVVSLRKTYADVLRYQSELIAKSIKLPRPNIVHAHDWSTFDAGRIIARHFRVPLVVTMHLSCNDLVPEVAQIGLKDLYPHIEDMQRGGLLDAEVVLHVSHHYQQKFSHVVGNKSIIVGNGINSDPWTQKHEPWIFPGDRPKKLVYIGRIAHMKNVDTLLSINLPDDVDLCLIGGQQGSDPKLWEKMKRIVQQHPQIHSLGPLYGKDKIQAMKSATAGIFPSRNEPFGLVGLEWMLAGVPFAASYVDGMQDYLSDGECALFCGTTKDQIEDAVFRLLNLSESERQLRIQAGIEKAQQYSWAQVAERVLGAYGIAINRLVQQGDGVPLPEWLVAPLPAV